MDCHRRQEGLRDERGYLDTEYGAEKCASQHHKQCGEKPCGDRLVNTWVAHLPVVVNTHRAKNAEDGGND